MKIIEGFRLREIMGQPALVGEGIGQINFNKLITLNASAAYLWQSVAKVEAFSIEDLTTLLTVHYGIDRTIARTDAENIVQAWINNGVVEA